MFQAFPTNDGVFGSVGGAGKLLVPGRPIWIVVGQRPTVLAVGSSGAYRFFFLSIISFSVYGGRSYRLNYCVKGPLNPKQPTNQNPTNDVSEAQEKSRPITYIPTTWAHEQSVRPL